MVVGRAALLRCAITDLSAQKLDSPAARASHLAASLAGWIAGGIDMVQLRAKELDAAEVLALATAAMAHLRGIAATPRPRLVLNGRADLALAAAADGVHLTARPGELHPAQVRALFAGHRTALGSPVPAPLVTVSCHTPAEVARAHQSGADAALFGSVFEKRVHGALITPGLGLHALAEACLGAPGFPVLALGGITPETLSGCLAAGAAGVAGIRLFDPSTPTQRSLARPSESATA